MLKAYERLIININYYFFLLVTILITVYSLLSINRWGYIGVENLDGLVVSNVLLTITIILYCFKDNRFKERFALFSFNVVYFILMHGRYFMNIGNASSYGKFVFSRVTYISYENEAKGLAYLFLAQFIVFIAYRSSYYLRIKIRTNKEEKQNIDLVRKYCKWTMIIGGFAAFTKLLAQIFYVIMYGYTSIYLSSGGALYQNPIIDMFDGLYLLGVYGYLATFPKYKEHKIVFIVFIIYSFMSILVGHRGTVVVNILFLVWYFMKVDELKINKKEIFNKTKILISGLIAIISFTFLYEYGFSRIGLSSNTDSFLKKIFSFIEAQGGTGKLTSVGLENKTEVLNYISSFRMVFSPVLNFFINNSFIRLFTGGVLGQTVENLYVAGSFSSVLTYITNPEAFLRGAGLGTSYVAELAVSYGILAVIIFNFILGRIFFHLDHIKLGNWVSNTFWLNAFPVLVYIPRQSTLGIIPKSVLLLMFLFIINILTKSRDLATKR